MRRLRNTYRVVGRQLILAVIQKNLPAHEDIESILFYGVFSALFPASFFSFSFYHSKIYISHLLDHRSCTNAYVWCYKRSAFRSVREHKLKDACQLLFIGIDKGSDLLVWVALGQGAVGRLLPVCLASENTPQIKFNPETPPCKYLANIRFFSSIVKTF